VRSHARELVEGADLGVAVARLAHGLAVLGPLATVGLVALATVAFEAPVAHSFMPAGAAPSLDLTFLRYLVAGCGLIVTAVVVNTMVFFRAQPAPARTVSTPYMYSDKDKLKLLQLMSGALQIDTISQDDPKQTDYSKLLDFHAYLRQQFPLVHQSAAISLTVVNQYSLLYEWKGADQTAKPIMLCAHQDVVPAPNAHRWEHPPFSGHIDDNETVWGRGSIDNKHNVIMQLRAVEQLLESGVQQPPRTIFLAYGHDEEVGGLQGAQHIAKEMASRLGSGNQLAFILDEGSFATKGLLPGLEDKPIALVGNVEKGYAEVHMTVDALPPCHSSLPPKETNVGILARAIDRLEKRPMPCHLDAYLNALASLSSELPWFLGMVLANLWLFKPLLKAVLLAQPMSAGVCRTSTAVTIVNAGEKINVIPGLAEAWINHRIHPDDINSDRVVAYDRKVIGDKRVKLKVNMDTYIPPSPVSAPDAETLHYLRATLQTALNVPAVPALMSGNTDTRWYWDLTPNIYRHSAVIFEKQDDAKMFHGLNERITGDQLAGLVHFYTCLMQGLGSMRA